MSTENPCFKKQSGRQWRVPSVDNLRLELNPKCFCLLPYHHLEFVKFESDAGQDTLTLLFLNRTVSIRGKNLRELGLALQDRCVEFVKPHAGTVFVAGCGDEASVNTIEIQHEQKENSHA